MTLRNDWDKIWKNWLVSERIKWNRLNNKEVEYYFWKTHTKQIMDYIEVENGSANVYEDLGLPDAAQMLVKATLAAKIGEIIKHRHLTQIQAAEILGMPQPKLSGMLRGQFRGISEAKMLECMNRLGRDVQIVVRKPSRSRTIGRTSVVFA